jgi:hypothetical protein
MSVSCANKEQRRVFERLSIDSTQELQIGVKESLIFLIIIYSLFANSALISFYEK